MRAIHHDKQKGRDAGRMFDKSVRTIRRWVSDCRSDGISAPYDGNRTGRPRKAEMDVYQEIAYAQKENGTLTVHTLQKGVADHEDGAMC